MINPTKRNPLALIDSFSFGEKKSYIVVYEFSIGPNGDIEATDNGILFQDIKENKEPVISHIRGKIEEFVRYVYESFPEDYTHKNLTTLMKSRSIDETQLANSVINLLCVNNKNLKEVRVFAIYRATNVTFSIQFIKDNDEIIKEIPTNNFMTNSFYSRPSRDSKNQEFRLSYELALPLDYETLDNRKGWYISQAVSTLQNFIAFSETNMNNYNRSVIAQRAANKYALTNFVNDLKTEISKVSLAGALAPERFQTAVFDVLKERENELDDDTYDDSKKLVSEHIVAELKYVANDNVANLAIDYKFTIGRLRVFNIPDPINQSESIMMQDFIPISDFHSPIMIIEPDIENVELNSEPVQAIEVFEAREIIRALPLNNELANIIRNNETTSSN